MANTVRGEKVGTFRGKAFYVVSHFELKVRIGSKGRIISLNDIELADGELEQLQGMLPSIIVYKDGKFETTKLANAVKGAFEQTNGIAPEPKETFGTSAVSPDILILTDGVNNNPDPASTADVRKAVEELGENPVGYSTFCGDSAAPVQPNADQPKSFQDYADDFRRDVERDGMSIVKKEGGFPSSVPVEKQSEFTGKLADFGERRSSETGPIVADLAESNWTKGVDGDDYLREHYTLEPNVLIDTMPTSAVTIEALKKLDPPQIAGYYYTLDKGTARQVRKLLRAAGRPDLAALPRAFHPQVRNNAA